MLPNGKALGLGACSGFRLRFSEKRAIGRKTAETRGNRDRADAAKIGLTTGLTIVEKKLNILSGCCLMVRRLVWDQDGAGSIPVTPTKIADLTVFLQSKRRKLNMSPEAVYRSTVMPD